MDTTIHPTTDQEDLTILTSSQLRRMEQDIAHEVRSRLGEAPTLENLNREFDSVIERELGPKPTEEHLKAQGYHDSFIQQITTYCVQFLQSLGRITSWLVAELLQSWAALIIGVVFGLLEYERVRSGALMLGQEADQAVLIAVAVVVANVIHPIYALRQLRGDGHVGTLKQERHTLAGYLQAFKRRIAGKPWVEERDINYNRTLDVAAAVITWGTIVIAIYDLLGPLLWEIFAPEQAIQVLHLNEETAAMLAVKPVPIMALELVIGLALSFAGVFFLQSAAHEIGVRTLTEKTETLTDVLQREQQRYQARRDARWQETLATLPDREAIYRNEVAAIREEIRQQYMAAAVADAKRKQAEKQGKAGGQLAAPEMRQPELPLYSNGNGNHHSNGAGTGTRRA